MNGLQKAILSSWPKPQRNTHRTLKDHQTKLNSYTGKEYGHCGLFKECPNVRTLTFTESLLSASYVLTYIIDWTSMKTCRMRLSYPDFADKAPNGFSNLPGVIRLVRAGGGNPVQVDSKTLFEPWKGLGNKQSLLFEYKQGSVLWCRQGEQLCTLWRPTLRMPVVKSTFKCFWDSSGESFRFIRHHQSWNHVIKQNKKPFFNFSHVIKKTILNKEYACVCKI